MPGSRPTRSMRSAIGDMTIGDAIVDRVIHRAHRLELKGGSLRKRQVANKDVSLTDIATE